MSFNTLNIRLLLKSSSTLVYGAIAQIHDMILSDILYPGDYLPPGELLTLHHGVCLPIIDQSILAQIGAVFWLPSREKGPAVGRIPRKRGGTAS